ncbi:MAG: ribosome biogenesis GTP-binding protein YihA/YsxC [Rikenellaceae bacterium]|nr:ribosome biogenesis GTP-binding protein YihA/YsxC [Rikenellaceae bacterium]
MIIKTAEFKCSSAKAEQCPVGDIPEFAFIGRSNVGKSSLTNMLTGRKSLAKVSGTPGKTALINHFIINGEWYLVDLPGYGYAKVSKEKRKAYSDIISCYILKSENLKYLFVLVDSRLEPQKNDLELMDFLNEHGINYGLVFTKTDKLSDNKIFSNITKYKKILKAVGKSVPDIFITSSEKKTGREELLDFIENTIKEQ